MAFRSLLATPPSTATELDARLRTASLMITAFPAADISFANTSSATART